MANLENGWLEDAPFLLGFGLFLGANLLFPRDPGSPKLRMVSWSLNALRFGGDYTPQSSSDKVIGSLGLSFREGSHLSLRMG